MTEGAYDVLDRLMGWLAERLPGAEDRLSSRFLEAIQRLETNPFTCGLAYENPLFDEEVRHHLFETRKGRVYRALFVIRGSLVKVLCVRAPGEKPVQREDLGS